MIHEVFDTWCWFRDTIVDTVEDNVGEDGDDEDDGVLPPSTPRTFKKGEKSVNDFFTKTFNEAKFIELIEIEMKGFVEGGQFDEYELWDYNFYLLSLKTEIKIKCNSFFIYKDLRHLK